MSISNCRVCGAPFHQKPLLVLQNMPAVAQNFPDDSNLHEDQGANLTICQCAGCGLVQLSNPPVSYYRDVIRAAGYSEEMGTFRREQFSQLVKKHHLTRKKILELGSGRGEYIGLMLEAGIDAWGIEHDIDAVTECQGKNLQVFQGYPEDNSMMMEHGPFDGFFILNFFEHLPDPNTALQVMANNLKDGGIGLVEVPNFDAILEKKLFSEFINDHLFYFTEETLVSTLNYNGFEVIDCKSVWHDYILSATVRKKSPIDLGPLVTYQERISTELNAYLDLIKAKKAAVWGAGHQALAVLALANLAPKIDVVLDSAPFKQDRYTPSTHIPVKDPLLLEELNIDLLVVMAASYSDEVLRLVEERHPRGESTLKHVAVLRDSGLEIIRG